MCVCVGFRKYLAAASSSTLSVSCRTVLFCITCVCGRMRDFKCQQPPPQALSVFILFICIFISILILIFPFFSLLFLLLLFYCLVLEGGVACNGFARIQLRGDFSISTVAVHGAGIKCTHSALFYIH